MKISIMSMKSVNGVNNVMANGVMANRSEIISANNNKMANNINEYQWRNVINGNENKQ